LSTTASLVGGKMKIPKMAACLTFTLILTLTLTLMPNPNPILTQVVPREVGRGIRDTVELVPEQPAMPSRRPNDAHGYRQESERGTGIVFPWPRLGLYGDLRNGWWLRARGEDIVGEKSRTVVLRNRVSPQRGQKLKK